MPMTSRVVLGEGGTEFDRLQSLFGFVRAHGGGEPLAWIARQPLRLQWPRVSSRCGEAVPRMS